MRDEWEAEGNGLYYRHLTVAARRYRRRERFTLYFRDAQVLCAWYGNLELRVA